MTPLSMRSRVHAAGETFVRLLAQPHDDLAHCEDYVCDLSETGRRLVVLIVVEGGPTVSPACCGGHLAAVVHTAQLGA